MANFKQGQTVQWTSQAGGNTLTKTGTVIAVCRDKGVQLTKKTAVQILRETQEITVKDANTRATRWNVFDILQQKYRLKFDPYFGWRENTHYLVEVEREGGQKPLLYHPRTEALKPVG